MYDASGTTTKRVIHSCLSYRDCKSPVTCSTNIRIFTGLLCQTIVTRFRPTTRDAVLNSPLVIVMDQNLITTEVDGKFILPRGMLQRLCITYELGLPLSVHSIFTRFGFGHGTTELYLQKLGLAVLPSILKLGYGVLFFSQK